MTISERMLNGVGQPISQVQSDRVDRIACSLQYDM